MSGSIIRNAHKFLLLLLLAYQAFGRRVQPDLSIQTARLPLPPSRNDSTTELALGNEGQVQLKLCECERAIGAPAGLSCAKHGWFISGFERQGQWVSGGGYVPLSHAICCRPCLPQELPPDPSGQRPAGEVPVAVISLGCHPSTDRDLSTRCELSGSSLVSGYSEAVKVFTMADTAYPINAVQCCTPALLLDSGDAWELERCGCHDSSDPEFPINCGGTVTDDLLLGFSSFRLSPLGHVVPVGPAQCCSVCLSGKVHPMRPCADLNSCSGRGVCTMRRCECFQGWTGPDCGQAAGSGKSIPPWAIALIVLSSSALAGIFIIAAGYALQALGLAPSSPGASEDGDGDERQPLLIRLDGDDGGSVGSADTTDCEDEVEPEEVERRVTRAIQRLEHAVVRAQGQDAPPAAAAHPDSAAALPAELEAGGAQGGEQADSFASPGTEAGAAQQRVGDTEAAAVTATRAPAAQDAAAAGAEAVEVTPAALPLPAGEEPRSGEVAAPSDGEANELQKPRCGPTPEGPLAMVDCSVCMSRPVQVVVVPCGHVCMCRRCSRRLNRCPMCRKDIARRQRLFV